MEVGFATKSETTAHLPVEAALRERVSCLLMCSEALGCLRARSSSHWTLPQVEHRLYSRSSTPFELVATYTSGSAVHIDCKGTSCHTWSSSSRSCCKRWVSGQQTSVLYLESGGLLRCSGYDHVQCSGVAKDHYGLSAKMSPAGGPREAK